MSRLRGPMNDPASMLDLARRILFPPVPVFGPGAAPSPAGDSSTFACPGDGAAGGIHISTDEETP